MMSLCDSDVEVSHEDKIAGIFLDPTGDHAIVSLAGSTNFYLHRMSKTLRQLPKFNVCRVYRDCDCDVYDR